MGTSQAESVWPQFGRVSKARMDWGKSYFRGIFGRGDRGWISLGCHIGMP